MVLIDTNVNKKYRIDKAIQTGALCDELYVGKAIHQIDKMDVVLWGATKGSGAEYTNTLANHAAGSAKGAVVVVVTGISLKEAIEIIGGTDPYRAIDNPCIAGT